MVMDALTLFPVAEWAPASSVRVGDLVALGARRRCPEPVRFFSVGSVVELGGSVRVASASMAEGFCVADTDRVWVIRG